MRGPDDARRMGHLVVWQSIMFATQFVHLIAIYLEIVLHIFWYEKVLATFCIGQSKRFGMAHAQTEDLRILIAYASMCCTYK